MGEGANAYEVIIDPHGEQNSASIVLSFVYSKFDSDEPLRQNPLSKKCFKRLLHYPINF